jgi:hypothetical protein
MRRIRNLPLACAALMLVACGQQAQSPADTSEPQAPASTATVWPKALNPFGDGYPKAGDPCRRVGESAATANYLDDSAILIVCAASDAAAIAALGGKTVAEVEGIALISISQGDANVGMTAPEAPPATEQGTSTQ